MRMVVALCLSSECRKLICFVLFRVPAFYAKKVYNRLVFTWGWTKLSVRHSLGLSRTPGKSKQLLKFNVSIYITFPSLFCD